MESYALHPDRVAAKRGPLPLLRLAGDERLVALTRSGNQGAFEVIVARYQARLLAFCTRIVGSREDAEDVLQEAFAAAFNALLADEREINLRPWLYRIARNRSLNHLRRKTAIGVDSMDIHYADMGISTSDKMFKREEFRLLVGDIGHLAETQRTALLLREIEGMSYEQIAVAMDQTVPGIKSLLVRARIGLAEARETRDLSCDEVRVALGEVAEGLATLSGPARRHVKECERCGEFRGHLRSTNRALAAMAPFGPLLLLKHFIAAKLGLGGASAGGSAAAAGGAATAGGAAAVSGGTAGAITASAVTAKAIAFVAAAAIAAAGAAAVTHTHHTTSASASISGTPLTLPQSAIAAASPPVVHNFKAHHHAAAPLATIGAPSATALASTTAASTITSSSATVTPNSEEVTTTTVFPGAAAGPTGVTGSSPSTNTTAVTVTPAAASTVAPVTGAGTTTGSSGASGATTSTGTSGTTGATTP